MQATALKLHATKGELEQVLQQARERLEAGLPPTDDTEMEWLALVRQEQTLEDLKAQREQVRVGCAAKGASGWAVRQTEQVGGLCIIVAEGAGGGLLFGGSQLMGSWQREQVGGLALVLQEQTLEVLKASREQVGVFVLA